MNYLLSLLLISHFIAILTGMFLIRLIDIYFNDEEKNP
jgi:hypothetical protein